MYKLLPILLFAYGLAITTEDVYDNSWAVIIGIDDYHNHSNLQYAVEDAKAVKEILLSKFNYSKENVKLLLNEDATKTNIQNTIEDISLNAGENDRILIFFSGHGVTMSLPEGGEMGYLLPINGNQEKLYTSAIPMNDLKDLSYMSNAKHMLFLIDACYGGLAAAGTKSLDAKKTSNYIEKITNKKSRQIITAGGKTEEVIEKAEWGHSAYTKNLLSALEDGQADANEDGYITANELGNYLSEKVSIDSENQQTPQSHRLTSHEGEFIFFNMGHIEQQTININNNIKIDNINNLHVNKMLSDSTINNLQKQINHLTSELNVSKVLGCTDNNATNFNPNANVNDNSCIILGANDAYIKFGKIDTMSLIMNVFIKTGIGSTSIDAINFNTEGFLIEEIIDGELINNDNKSVSLEEENYVSSTFNPFYANYEEKLLFKALINPTDDKLCINNMNIINEGYHFDQIYVDPCLQNLSTQFIVKRTLKNSNHNGSLYFNGIDYEKHTLKFLISIKNFRIVYPQSYEPILDLIFYSEESGVGVAGQFTMSKIGLQDLWHTVEDHADSEPGTMWFNLKKTPIEISVADAFEFKNMTLCFKKAEFITYHTDGNEMEIFDFKKNSIDCIHTYE